MADDKTKATPINEEATAAGDPGRKVLDLSEIKTADGQPVFAGVTVDPETGDLLDVELTPEMQEALTARYKEIAQAAGELITHNADAVKQATEAAKKAMAPALQAAAGAAKFTAALKLQAEQLQAAVKSITDNFLTDETRELIKQMRDNLQPIADLYDELKALEPYLKAELEKPEYAEAINQLRDPADKKQDMGALDIVLHSYTPGDLLELLRDHDSYIYRAWEAARLAKETDTETQIQAYKANKLDLPTDKLNLFAWDLRETKGQIKFDLSRAGTDDTATALFSLTFDDDPNITLTKEINHFDKRVMSACGTAFASGYPIISATGIYYAMGNTGKPAQKHIDKINDTLTKLDMAKVFVDNTIEAGTYKYPKFRKEDRLLHFKRVSRIVNGKTTDSIIQILEEPVLMTFARQRKQISAIPIKVLQTPARRTNNYYQIEDYLLWRIAQQKNVVNKLRDQQKKKYTQHRQAEIREAAKLTILLKTFYERTGNGKKDNTGKKRARNTAEECLKHYKTEAGGCWITDYEMTSDRIIITLPTK